MDILLAVQLTIAQTLLSQAQTSQAQPSQLGSPLVNQSGQDVIYLGMGLMAIVVILIIGLLSRRLEYAIVLSLILAAVIILLVTLV